MAIIIEEEKDRSNLTRLIGWLAIFVIIIAAIYYVFFAAPQLVIIAPSDSISTIEPIANQTINASDILDSPAFKALAPSTIPPVATTTTGGRLDPFITP